MPLRIAIPDMISPSYFPAIAAVELGFFEREGLDASIELVFPVTDTYEMLRDGDVDYVGGSAHAALYAFPDWDGCRILCALSQGMYWFLVVRADLEATTGDLTALKGLRVGAAPGPVDGLRAMLTEQGIDPELDVEVGPVPGAAGAGVSFGVTAAKALEDGAIDGFWANGMGAEVAIRSGAGRLLVDARRPPHPAGVEGYTFPALVCTTLRLADDRSQVAAATRAVVAAQRALRDAPELATRAAAPHFPNEERGLIAELVRRDSPFYDPEVAPERVNSMNRFAHRLGLLSVPDVAYDRVVATDITTEWTR